MSGSVCILKFRMVLLILLSHSIVLHAQMMPSNSTSSAIRQLSDNHSSSYEDVVVNLSGIWYIYPDKNAWPEWQTTIDVPGFYVWKKQANDRFLFPDIEMHPWRIFEGHPEGLYEQKINIPYSMSGKRIFLRFEAVNFVADIYMNGHLAGSHFGGYIPFEIEITPYVSIPSTDNTLRVAIRYNTWAFLGEFKEPQTPVGFVGESWNLGIIDSVFLFSRAPVFIDDVFVQTSVRSKKIFTTITIMNSDMIDHTVTLTGIIKDDDTQALTLGSQQITILQNETKIVTLEQNWQNPQLWSPDNPHLYHCVVELTENSQTINTKRVRFGFREFWIENDHFMLNGYHYNLRGDNIIIDSEKHIWHYLIPDRENWTTIIDSMKALHFNTIRLHQQPAFPWMIDICDEKGILAVAESAIYGYIPMRWPDYVDNSVDWIQDWIKRDRNHPCIVMWSAENEEWYHLEGRLLPEHLAQLGDAVVLADTSRPYLFEGDFDGEGKAPVYSYHYMGGFPSIYPWPSMSLYEKYSSFVNPNKPTSWGEFEWCRGNIPRDTWVKRQALVTRAGRIVNADDIRPYRLDWTWHPIQAYFEEYEDWTPTRQQVTFLSNSMNPVAVFDKSYFEYNLDPSMPQYDEGAVVNRSLIIFNDEEKDTHIEVRWELLIEGESVGDGSLNVEVPLGTHIERQLTFTAPYVPSDMTFELQISSWKSGIRKFIEKTPFISRDAGIAAPCSITDLHAQRLGNMIYLSWPPVTHNTEGEITVIDHYVLYRATDCNFTEQSIEFIQQVADTSYMDNASDILGNSSKNGYYRVKAVDTNGLSSEFSQTMGEFDYYLHSLGTGFNAIGLPLILPGITDSQSLLELLSSCYSVARWDAMNQGFEQYIPEIPSSNFAIQMGYPYYIQTDTDTVFTLLGYITDPTFQLYTTPATDFNEIMLPLKKTGITNASSLMAAISYCDGVARWNSNLQGFEQYIPGISSTDFSVRTGYSYFVNVTQNTSWPIGGTPNKTLFSQSDKNTLFLNRTQIPHAVWGQWISECDSVRRTIQFSAYIVNRPDEKLTEVSPGCSATDRYWIIQCGNFPTGWKAGETLKIEFYGTDNIRGDKEIELSYAASDLSDDVLLIKDMSVPLTYELSQNYPNPFNAATTIRYSLPEPSSVEITIYNLLGQKIRTLVPDERQSAGFHAVLWDGTDANNHPQTSGVYIVAMKVNTSTKTMKIHLIR